MALHRSMDFCPAERRKAGFTGTKAERWGTCGPQTLGRVCEKSCSFSGTELRVKIHDVSEVAREKEKHGSHLGKWARKK